jgi:hypothetical protein
MDLHNDIGKTMLSRDGQITGTVVDISRRYCAACQQVHSCYKVEWGGGTKRTLPCTNGVRENPDGTLQIN